MAIRAWIEHPVEFLDSQDNRFIRHVGRRFEALELQAFEPEAEAVAFPVQDLHAITWFVEEDKKHWVEDCDLDVQLDQGSQAVNGLPEVNGFGVEIDFFDLSVGTHHSGGLQKEIGSTASGSSGGFESGVHGALTFLPHQGRRHRPGAPFIGQAR
jgi:hypothetical protein